MNPSVMLQATPKELEDCKSIVDDEIVALEAIYPDQISRTDDDPDFVDVKLELPIDLGGSNTFVITAGTSNTVSNDLDLGLRPPTGTTPTMPRPTNRERAFNYLPPIILDLRLPPDYPLLSPPTVLSAYSMHSWLDPILMGMLLTKFHDLWDEQKALGEGVLWRIAEMIVTGDFLESTLRLRSTDGRIVLQHAAPTLLTTQLTAYDASMNDASFAMSSFRCDICFEDRKGTACIRLSCDHVFCKECLKDGWGLAVKEGDCSLVRCPDQACMAKTKGKGKAKEVEEEEHNPDLGEATEEDVRRVLTGPEVERWKWLKAKRDIERDPTIVHCPLQFCQAPVSAPDKGKKRPQPDDVELSELAVGWQKLRTCEACGYSFCLFCKKAWHGPISPCSTRTGASFVEEYLALSEGSPKRQLIERTFGKANLERMIRRYNEEQENIKWLEKSTQKCPGCGVACEKSHGCNHMTCVRCLIHYCYRCGEKLNPRDVYAHFSMRGGMCYNKLFDFEETEEERMEWGWAAAVALL